MKKLGFILPGYPHSTEEENYQKMGDFYREEGFRPIFLEFEWSESFKENLKKAREVIEEKLEEFEDPEIYLFGHSWGAAIALTLSPEFRPETQILCGLSQEFREDRETFSRFDEIGGKILMKISACSTIFPKKRTENRPAWKK